MESTKITINTEPAHISCWLNTHFKLHMKAFTHLELKMKFFRGGCLWSYSIQISRRIDKIYILFLEIDVYAIALRKKWVILCILNGDLFQRHFADYGRFNEIILIYKKVRQFLVYLLKCVHQNFTGCFFMTEALTNCSSEV